MVLDKRRCLGCNKEVPNFLRNKLTLLGWVFIQVTDEEEDNTRYYSNCGCLTHEEFIQKVKEEELKG